MQANFENPVLMKLDQNLEARALCAMSVRAGHLNLSALSNARIILARTVYI